MTDTANCRTPALSVLFQRINLPVIPGRAWMQRDAAGHSSARNWRFDQLWSILRTSPSGSSAMRHWLSQTMVWLRSGSDGVQTRPGWLGFPVLAKFDHAVAIFLASVCASGVLPVPCLQRTVLSKQNCSSDVCRAPGTPSRMGVCQLKSIDTWAPRADHTSSSPCARRCRGR